MSTTTKRGWKVLDKLRNSFCVMTGGVRYEKDIETFPLEGHGPLCVFKDKRSALTYLSIEHEDFKITFCLLVPCKYKPSEEEYIYNRTKYNTVFNRYHISSLPTGTVLADSVTCLE